MPSALGRSSQALLGHCCEALQSQQGILGNGMQHDAAPLRPRPPPGLVGVSLLLALQALRQAVSELGGKGGGFLQANHNELIHSVQQNSDGAIIWLIWPLVGRQTSKMRGGQLRLNSGFHPKSSPKR